MRLAILLALVISVSASAAQAQGRGGGDMPDARQMSGVPLPVGDLPPGTVVVRIARGIVTNVIPDQAVVLTGGAAPMTVKTNETGRAEFPGLAPGTRVKATATVDGERLESQEFAVPATGGIRVALIATDPEMEKRAAENRRLAESPAVPGLVVLGEQSRFVIELGEEALNVFDILEIVNTARVPVQPPTPVVFELPEESAGAGILEGSSPKAVLEGKRLTVNGPFAPGATLVQVGYSLPFSGGDATVRQKLPIALNQLNVMAQKVGDMQLHSAQLSQHRDMAAEGQTFTVGQGPALNAGDTLTLNLSGLPHHALWPRNVALTLAFLILAGGAWGMLRGGRVSAAGAARRKALEARRDRLFADLTTLEEQHRDRAIDPERYVSRRRELVTALERVYAELDEEAAA